MRYQFTPHVQLLLINQTSEKVQMQYMNDEWQAPLIKTRPPYYTNPRYVLNFPVI